VRQPIWFEFVFFNYSYYGSAVEGWTSAGMDKIHKIDSFVLEVQRIDGPIISRSNPFPLPQHKQ